MITKAHYVVQFIDKHNNYNTYTCIASDYMTAIESCKRECGITIANIIGAIAIYYVNPTILNKRNKN